MAFFTKWWSEQSEAKRDSVKKLVHEGRLAFVNGGWCMHDEAATHFMGMIDQTTLGHRFLKETFDYKPRVGWQVGVRVPLLCDGHILPLSPLSGNSSFTVWQNLSFSFAPSPGLI